MRRPVTARAPTNSKHKLMRGVEDLGQFHANGGEVVDIEEAPVVDFLRGHAPEGEAIGLIVQQFVERIEAAPVAGRAVDLRERGLDSLLHLRRFLATPLEPLLDDLLLARPLRDAVGIGFAAPRQIFQRGHDALEFGVEIFVLKAAPAFRARWRGCGGRCRARSGIRDRNNGAKTSRPRIRTFNSPRSRTRPY